MWCWLFNSGWVLSSIPTPFADVMAGLLLTLPLMIMVFQGRQRLQSSVSFVFETDGENVTNNVGTREWLGEQGTEGSVCSIYMVSFLSDFFFRWKTAKIRQQNQTAVQGSCCDYSGARSSKFCKYNPCTTLLCFMLWACCMHESSCSVSKGCADMDRLGAASS